MKTAKARPPSQRDAKPSSGNAGLLAGLRAGLKNRHHVDMEKVEREREQARLERERKEQEGTIAAHMKNALMNMRDAIEDDDDDDDSDWDVEDDW